MLLDARNDNILIYFVDAHDVGTRSTCFCEKRRYFLLQRFGSGLTSSQGIKYWRRDVYMLESFMSILKIVLRRSGHTLDGDTNHMYHTCLFFIARKLFYLLLNDKFIFFKNSLLTTCWLTTYCSRKGNMNCKSNMYFMILSSHNTNQYFQCILCKFRITDYMQW